MTVETTTIPIVTVARTNGVNGRSFTKLHKDKLSGFREWKQLDHAERSMCFMDPTSAGI